MSFRFLVVDDSAFMRRTLVNYFVEKGWVVAGEAADGKEAYFKYVDLKPDVVTMDITMPKMDGLEAVSAIVKVDPEARIIMCSALGDKDMVVESIKRGAKSFIVKPYKQEKVIEVVEQVLATIPPPAEL